MGEGVPRMGNHRLPKMIELENARQTYAGGGGGEGMDGLRGRGSSGVWHHGRLNYRRTRPLGLVQTVCEGGFRFMTACVREDGKASKNRQRKRGGEGRGRSWGDRRKLETLQSHVGWTNPRIPEATLAAPVENPENPDSSVMYVKIVCKCEVVAIRGGGVGCVKDTRCMVSCG